MRGAVLVLVLATAGGAHAQAPGEVAPSPPEASSVLARRWAVTLGFGSLGLESRTDGAETVSFAMLELGGRFRIIRTIEVGLSLFGGGAKDDLSTGGLVIDGRYRFMADRPWNVFVSLGLGVVSVAGKDASDDEKRGRGAMRIGVGVERRFRALAIDAQLRIVGIGENPDLAEVPAPAPSYDLARSRLSGGSLTVAGTYYF